MVSTSSGPNREVQKPVPAHYALLANRSRSPVTSSRVRDRGCKKSSYVTEGANNKFFGSFRIRFGSFQRVRGLVQEFPAAARELPAVR